MSSSGFRHGRRRCGLPTGPLRAALDNGYYSQSNIETLERQGIEPFIAVGRQSHYPALEERLTPPPEAPKNPDAVSAMKHRLRR